MAPVRPSITFRLFKGEQLLREEQLTLPVIKVGKVPTSHLRIDDESVSRMHAVIEVTSATDVSVIDLGSTRGTYVNDQKINKAQIQTGDVLLIGDVRIEIAIGAGEAKVEPKVEPKVEIAAAPPPLPPPPPPRPAPMATVAVARPVAVPVIADDLDGARAVEVAAMLGDSVVEVKHCMNPRSTGRVKPATYGVLGVGAAMLVVAMIWFAMGVRNASFNEHKLEHWTTPVAEGGLGKPAYSFRPRMLTSNPALYDAITFGGMLGGLVLLAWGVARMRNERSSPWFHVESHALVAPSGDDFMLSLAPGMDGELTVDGQTSPLSGAAFAIPPKARIRVRSGKTTYLVSSVTVPRRYPVPLLAGVEANVAAYFAGSAILFLGIWALLRTAHGGLDTANGDDDSSELARLDGSTESKEEPPPDPLEETDDVPTEEPGGQGQQMALTEGKAGKEDSEQAEGRIKIKQNSDNPALARQQALNAAKVAGILGSESFASAAFTSLTGTGDLTSGWDDSDIYGGFLGDQAGEMKGGFGFGADGFGPGGGGKGWGTIGSGPFGTIGGGGGTGDGYNVGGGRCGDATCKGRKAAVPVLRIGAPQGGGDLDKATIRRYIKRSLPKFKYCYEKELLASPGLSGTVDTQFLISVNGTVGEVHAKGINADVASCVASVIKGISFPKPKGGGPVNVTSYPFEFHPSGG